MVVLFWWGAVGLVTTINKMTDDKNNSKLGKKTKLKRVIELLKFVLTLDDLELTKSTVESVIELLEEMK